MGTLRSIRVGRECESGSERREKFGSVKVGKVGSVSGDLESEVGSVKVGSGE